jgi:hypothetical protein
MTEAAIPINDQQIGTLWLDAAATIADIPVPPACDPTWPAGICSSCELECARQVPASFRPELVTITSPNWGAWNACRACGSSQLDALHGTPVTSTAHPIGVRQIAREQLWLNGVRGAHAVTDH